MTDRLISTDAIDGDFTDVTLEQDDIDKQIEHVIGEFGDEEINATKLKVYKTIPNMGKMEWLFDCTINELPIMERLRDEYGGGKYEARLYSGTPLKLKKKFEILIGSMKRAAVVKTDNNREMMTVMLEGFNKLGEIIVNQNKAATVNPMDSQMQMMQNMVAMKELLGIGQQPAQESPMKMMTQFVEMQKTLGGMMGESGGGGAGISDVMLSMANTILPKLADMGEKEQELKAAAIQGQPRARKIPRQAIPQNKANNPMKMHLIFLCAQAKANRDPMMYAQMVVENTATDKIAELKEFISGPNALTEMTGVHKAVGLYPQWFTELGECVVELLTGEQTLTNTPQSTINPVSDTIPGIIGSQTIAYKQPESTNRRYTDDDTVVSDP